ncbi:MAG: hypothetical protein WBV22_07255 [Anaerolineaceae bacterium]
MKSSNRITSGLKGFLQSNKARLWLLVTTIILFILAAGAPGASGGTGN